MKPTYTNQHAVRAAFWSQYSGQPYKLRNGDWDTDTRCYFVDFVDALARNGDISEALARRVTL